MCASVFPSLVAVLIAVEARVLFTGALHEDGLGDVCDGFGAGGGASRILAIMKDSHVGSYAVVGYAIYFLLLSHTLAALPLSYSIPAILVADPLAKSLAAQLVNLLPYARAERQSKIGVVYTAARGLRAMAPTLAVGMLPLLIIWIWTGTAIWPIAALAPLISTALLGLFFRHRIGGYTGDCLGATFLISELCYYLLLLALHRAG